VYTLAHECGHISLHNPDPGYAFPGHVKEFEAESYAHQAFRRHGMTVARRLSIRPRGLYAKVVGPTEACKCPRTPRCR
jgi:hypothetical protein